MSDQTRIDKPNLDDLTTPERLLSRRAEELQSTKEVYRHFCALLTKRVPFAFTRFGDGDFHCIFGKVGHNCDGHDYSPDLGARLKAILVDWPKPPYYVGIQRLARELFDKRPEFHALVDGKPGIPADVFHHANLDKKDRLGALFKILQARKTVLVGASYLLDLKKLPTATLIPVPEKNCWSAYKPTLNRCLTMAAPGTVFLFCASMLSKILIDGLWSQTAGCTLLDIGSAFDPHAGRLTRKYHKLMGL